MCLFFIAIWTSTKRGKQINRFNPATFLCLTQARSWSLSSAIMLWYFLCPLTWGERWFVVLLMLAELLTITFWNFIFITDWILNHFVKDGGLNSWSSRALTQPSKNNYHRSMHSYSEFLFKSSRYNEKSQFTFLNVWKSSAPCIIRLVVHIVHLQYILYWLKGSTWSWSFGSWVYNYLCT